MDSIHEHDPIELRWPIWIPIEETSPEWNGVLFVVSPNDAENVGATFTTELLTQEFIESQNPYFMVGNYVPERVADPARLLEYLDACVLEGLSYVGFDAKQLIDGSIQYRLRRIVTLRKQILKQNRNLAAASDDDSDDA